jgi:outer membrane lipopolysaccharide assembly protein LptE/RlpB
MSSQKIHRRRLALSPLLLLPTACATYKLGLPEGPPFKSIYIPVVRNNTFAPQMQAHMTRAIREEFARGGRPVVLTDEDSADSVLRITLTNYSRRTATVNPNDTGLPASYHLRLTASVSLIDNQTGNVYFKDRPFQEVIQSFGSDQLPERERQNLPLLARNLAKNIYEDVTTVW